MSAPVVVRGGATADEIAAVLTALARRATPEADDPYERWRRGRIAARSLRSPR